MGGMFVMLQVASPLAAGPPAGRPFHRLYLLTLLATLAVTLPQTAMAQPAEIAEGAETAASSFILKPSFSCSTDGYAAPFAGFNGQQVLYSNGQRVVGIDPQTSLVRWEGGELKAVRRVIELEDRLLVIGEHVQMLETGRGKRIWDFPLNCFGPAQCNADALAVTDDRFLVGGFGQVYNMIQLVGIADGKEIWPSWVTTCGISTAGIVADSVVLVCNSETSLVSRVDFKSRRTLYNTPSPARGFQPMESWFSESHVYVTGVLGGQKKLYVFATADGSLKGKFNIKEAGAGQDMGFVISTTAARFVPWQKSAGKLVLWGIDVTTGKVAWQNKWPGGKILGQVESTLALLAGDARGGFRAVGLDLATGDTLFDFPVPFREPKATLLKDDLFLIGAKSKQFVVIDTAAARIAYLGVFDSPPTPGQGGMYFSENAGNFVTLVGNQVTMFSRTSATERVKELTALLDSGNEMAAREQYASLAPFRRTLPDAGAAFREMTRFDWLQAELKLRQKDLPGAIDTAKTIIADGRNWNPAEFRFMFPMLSRFAVQVALTRSSGPARLDFLMDTLALLAARSAKVETSQAPDFVDLAVLLAGTLFGSAHESPALGVMDQLHDVESLTPLLASHPYRLKYQVDEIKMGLDLADQARKEGDFAMAADLLREMSINDTAAELYGSNFDPWLDAAGIYLLPEDLQAMKLPKLLKALKNRFDSAARKLMKQTDTDLCERACDLAERTCPFACVDSSACAKSARKCNSGCRKGRAVWRPAPFSVSPVSTTFFKCR